MQNIKNRHIPSLTCVFHEITIIKQNNFCGETFYTETSFSTQEYHEIYKK